MEENQDPVVLDQEAALANVDGDVELLAETAALFLEEYPRQLSALQKAVKQGDARATMHHAHTLKGSVANFAAREAQQAAFELESMGRQGDLHGAILALEALERALARLHPLIARLAEKRAVTGP